MRRTTIYSAIALCALLASAPCLAQHPRFVVLPQIKLPHDSIESKQLLNSLDCFLNDKNNRLHRSDVVEVSHYEKFKFFFDELAYVEYDKQFKDSLFYICYLTNVVPQAGQGYRVSFVFQGITPDRQIIHKLSASLLAQKGGPLGFRFYCLFDENTRNWSGQKLDHITFYSQSGFDAIVAADFEDYNTQIARKLSVPPLQFKYYKCRDLQHVYELMGIHYDVRINGNKRSGYFDHGSKLFLSGTGTDQYKHDLTHAYFDLILPDSMRNWTAEEGYNIYTTDYWGESGDKIFEYLTEYFQLHPDESVMLAFEKKRILRYPIPIKYPIAAVLMRKIEREYGFDAVLKLIGCGETDADFFLTLEKTTGIRSSDLDQIIPVELGIK